MGRGTPRASFSVTGGLRAPSVCLPRACPRRPGTAACITLPKLPSAVTSFCRPAPDEAARVARPRR
ncbi:hypothetical protein E2C01_040181 [Portunus trituberculatus]|uniref:Uncharacterized protein n=1 Tax=Portunus trituberculatus TaxID=210409 RepID=A0A5B7FJ02_PORTR|nr:hypothetical protein [Portunus trituberculatus]